MGTEEQAGLGHQTAAEDFDSYKDKYDDEINSALGIPGLKVDYFTKVKADIFLETIEAHFGDAKSCSVLDVGCGIGNNHGLIGPYVGSLSGVDVSEKSLEMAAERNPSVAYKSYDGNVLPFPDEHFDVVYAICVVHHVPVVNWPGFFSELRRVLKPGGIATIFDHNPINPLSMWVVNRCPFDADAVLLRQSKMRSLLDGAGFQGVTSRSILTIPSFGKITRSIDKAFGRLPFGAQYLAIGEKQNAGSTDV